MTHTYPARMYSQAYKALLGELVAARKAAGLTQRQLSDKLKRSDSFISKIECRDRRLSVDEYLSVCRILGVNPGTLLDRVSRSAGTR